MKKGAVNVDCSLSWHVIAGLLCVHLGAGSWQWEVVTTEKGVPGLDPSFDPLGHGEGGLDAAETHSRLKDGPHFPSLALAFPSLNLRVVGPGPCPQNSCCC